MFMKKSSELITNQELLKKLLLASGQSGWENLSIFDCSFDLTQPTRWRKNYEIAHIPGAYYADLNHDLSSPPSEEGQHPLPKPEKFLSFLQQRGVKKNSLVVVYDNRQGDFAARMWWLLKWIGHQKVKLLDGGLEHWIATNKPMENSPVPFKPGDISQKESLVEWVNIKEVEENLTNPQATLVDSRTQDRYLGFVEPFYRKKGHIPGALHRFYQENLGPDHCFKPKEQLKKEWLALQQKTTHKDLIFYCGSGVTACHNILAAKQAGIDAKLYTGSFSQWVLDDKRPVATKTNLPPT